MHSFTNYLKQSIILIMLLTIISCKEDEPHTDLDDDGIINTLDLCPGTSLGEPVDIDGCALYQLDSDDDGVTDDIDMCPETGFSQMVDVNGCSRKQMVIPALNSEWTLTEAQVGNISMSSFSFEISDTKISFTGDVVNVFDEVSFSVSEEGYIINMKVNVTSDDLVLDGEPSLSINDSFDRLELSFSLKLGRTNGLGDFILVWTRV